MDRKQSPERPDFNFSATGIGSVPFIDIQGTCRHVLDSLPRIPYWPQFVKRSHLEDMIIQFSEGLPLLEVIPEKRTLALSSAEMEPELVSFYERYMAEDLPYFAISEKYAAGLYELLASIRREPEKYGPCIKGQTVGPVTFAAGIIGHDGKSLLHNPDLLDVVVKGLAIKALWQVRELESTGKRPILFLDEPHLSGFGSAFSPIQRDEVVRLLKEVIEYLKARSDVLIGIHCCGNTDWSMIIESDPDIINFDAFGYLDFFLLYPEEISRFLEKGGSIAWGIVPTAQFTGDESVEHLHRKLQDGLNRVKAWGIHSDTLIRRSLLTPACGMGSMGEASAADALNLLAAIANRYQDPI